MEAFGRTRFSLTSSAATRVCARSDRATRMLMTAIALKTWLSDDWLRTAQTLQLKRTSVTSRGSIGRTEWLTSGLPRQEETLPLAWHSSWQERGDGDLRSLAPGVCPTMVATDCSWRCHDLLRGQSRVGWRLVSRSGQLGAKRSERRAYYRRHGATTFIPASSPRHLLRRRS